MKITLSKLREIIKEEAAKGPDNTDANRVITMDVSESPGTLKDDVQADVVEELTQLAEAALRDLRLADKILRRR